MSHVIESCWLSAFYLVTLRFFHVHIVTVFTCDSGESWQHVNITVYSSDNQPFRV